ncbi:hypothetical protein R3P38DRAFT_2959391 [Favolaschia claudopus]|uniref:F-box domain-containing protein n=1 Tax=Favolaschia claudopus TaxID=2862362 RepID=A0AAW0B8I9_9AGAR
MILSESPFVRHFDTNYVPSDAEVLQIRSLLSGPEDAVARLDVEIEGMESALTQLKERRKTLMKPITAHRVLISPLRRTPDDVLFEIFSTCLPVTHNALIDPAEAPLLLGRICRRWRAVAYSTPALWTSIHIPASQDHLGSDYLSGLGKAIEAWFQRSAHCPLSVSLVFPSVPAGSHLNAVVEKLISKLCSVSQRLRHLTLSGPRDRQLILSGPPARQLSFILTTLGADHLSLLQSITVSCQNGDCVFSDPAAMAILGLPTLKNISLRVTESTSPLTFPIQWQQLVRLKIDCAAVRTMQGQASWGFDTKDAIELLQRCPNLVWCHLRLFQVGHGDLEKELTPTPIHLPHIHELIWIGLSSVQWVKGLVAPKLRYFHVGTPHMLGPVVQAEATATGLTVAIDSNAITTSGFQTLLQCFTDVSVLCLWEPSGFGSTVISFSPTWSYLSQDLDDSLLILTDDLCPVLTHLTVRSDTFPFSNRGVLQFIKARVSKGTPLREIQVPIRRKMEVGGEVDIMPELEPLIRDGLQVTLQYRPLLKFDSRHGLRF